MFLVGHLALGYITAKGSSRILKTDVDVPLVFALSILPDIDLLIPRLSHRGPTHSIIATILIFLPILVIYGRRSAPYLLATLQHSLLGDFLTGGAQLMWPISHHWYGIDIALRSPTNITMEVTAFAASLTLMIVTGDLKGLLKPQRSNLLLTLPLAAFTVQLTGIHSIPAELAIPQTVYLILFSASILLDIRRFLSTTRHAGARVEVAGSKAS
jgi:hypothetical protein